MVIYSNCRNVKPTHNFVASHFSSSPPPLLDDGQFKMHFSLAASSSYYSYIGSFDGYKARAQLNFNAQVWLCGAL